MEEDSDSKKSLSPLDIIKESEKKLTAQDLLDMPPEDLSKREAGALLKQLKIITAILLGKKQNKELAKILNTDKSYTSKQIKELEEQGLIKREAQGREVTYEVDKFNVMKFLQSKVVIKWSKKKGESDGNREKNS